MVDVFCDVSAILTVEICTKVAFHQCLQGCTPTNAPKRSPLEAKSGRDGLHSIIQMSVVSVPPKSFSVHRDAALQLRLAGVLLMSGVV